MKIGDAILTIDRTRDEEERILQSIKSSVGKPSEIYTKYAKGIKNQGFWAYSQKKLKVKGFRPGKANHLVFQKITAGINNNNTTALTLFWDLYHQSVVDFVNAEHGNLNRLLLDNDMEGDSVTTDGIMEAIMKYIALYDVAIEQIEELYESWWFERTENLGKIFSNQELSLEIVREVVLRSERKQMLELENLKKNINKLELTIKGHDDIDKIKEEIDNIKNDNAELKYNFDLEFAKFQKKHMEIIEDNISELERKIIEGGDPKVSSSDIEIKVSKNEESISKINKKIEDLIGEKSESDKNKKADGFIFKNSSILRDNISKISEDHSFGKENTNFLRKILNSFNCFYVESDLIFRSISKEIIESGRVKEVISTPSMINLSQDEIESLKSFDVIYIKNCGSCFIEGYLIPMLMMSSSMVDKSFPKVFILHDESLNSDLVTSLKIHTMDITHNLLSEIKEISEMKEVAEGDRLNEVEEIDSHHRELLRILKNTGVDLNQQLFERYVRLSQLLSRYVDLRTCQSLSASSIVFPYIRACYGETKSNVVIEILSGIL